MTWTLFTSQQQRGAQVPTRPDAAANPPAEAVRDRAAQDHEQAGGKPQAGDYPASPIEHRDGQDNTPDAGEPRVEWDEVVQPQPQAGETELEEDQRGDDAEQVPDAQAQQALRELSGQDGEERDDAAREDRND